MAEPLRSLEQKRAEEASVLASPPLPATEDKRRGSDWALRAVGLGTILAVCYFAEQILVVILISILLAFVLAPIVSFLGKLRLPQWLSALLAVIFLLAVAVGIGYLGVNQATSFFHDLPEYAHRIHDKTSAWLSRTQSLQLFNGMGSKDALQVHETTNWTSLLTRGFGSVTEVLLTASFVPVLVFFMLTWQEHARNATVGLFPLDRRREVYATLGMISSMIRDFLLGNLIIAVLIGLVSMFVYAFLGIPFFYFAGLLSGLLSLIPYFGAVLAVLPPLFLGVGRLSLAHVGWIVLTAFTLHLTAMNVLYPKLLGGRLRLNPLAVTIALLVWGWLWGAMGLVLAVPITAGMKIIFDRVPSLRPFGVWLGEEKPIAQRSVPKQATS